jgi:hypothetical protein
MGEETKTNGIDGLRRSHRGSWGLRGNHLVRRKGADGAAAGRRRAFLFRGLNHWLHLGGRSSNEFLLRL